MKQLKKLIGAGLLMVTLGMPQAYLSAKSLKVLGWGAQSGPLKSFGVNSEAALRSAVAEINATGGVRMGDGSMAPMEVGKILWRCGYCDRVESPEYRELQ